MKDKAQTENRAKVCVGKRREDTGEYKCFLLRSDDDKTIFLRYNDFMIRNGLKKREKKTDAQYVCANGDTTRKTPKKEKMFSLPTYLLLMAVCGLMRLKFGAKSVLSPAFRRQKKQGAMLVLSNHVSPFNFAWFTTPFFGKKVSFVVAETMKYSQPIFAGLIDGYHAIVKKQFYADYNCIKNIKKYLDAGISVILCPEGKVSADGRTAPMAFAVAKLVKWLGYPVAKCIISGAGLTRPKWAHTVRKGKVVCEMDMLFSAEDTKSLSAEEIMEKITDGLAHNEHVWQAENNVVFNGKRFAEGLENMLYRCPLCGAEFAMSTAGNAIFCEKCGFSAAYSRTGRILPCDAEHAGVPARIDEWYDLIRASVKAETEKAGFSLSKPVKVMMENEKGNGYRYAVRGTLTLDSQNLSFRASEAEDGNRAEDAPETLCVPVSSMFSVATLPGISLDLSDGKHTYRMIFEGNHAATKYALAIEEMNAKKC